jgi:hypothetical protein
MKERLTAVMRGLKPDRHPFVTRLETWYKSHLRSGTLPERFAGMSLNQVHRAVGVGQLKFMVPYALRLRGVEVSSTYEGDVFYREFEPVFENFPGMWDIISNQKAGVTHTELKTPVGILRLQHEILPEGIFTATEPYLKEHLIKGDDDYRVVEHILERAEFVPIFDKIAAEQSALGDIAFVAPLLHRIPFQQVLLEYIGELNLFYALYDNPAQVQRLLELLDGQMLDILARLADFPWIYVEFPDNLHSLMTNPKLFKRYCLPAFQRYTQVLHAQGKIVGSHTDGEVKPLLSLLKESGLDVCESFSPRPLTDCTFEEAWNTWQGKPLIWGGIPSPLLEETVSEQDYRAFVGQLLETVGNDPVIFGVVDLFMRHNSIERAEYFAWKLENQPI